MTYDGDLAARVRTLLADRSDVSERQMFGGLTFMIAGHMCCGVNGDELIVRLDPGDEDKALARPHARPMDFTGRPMRGFVTVRPEGLNGAQLNQMGAGSRGASRVAPSQVRSPVSLADARS